MFGLLQLGPLSITRTQDEGPRTDHGRRTDQVPSTKDHGPAMLSIDLNADVGEGCGQDAALMPLISSANIACGGHAGDAESMREAVALALEHGVAIGAHPSF